MQEIWDQLCLVWELVLASLKNNSLQSSQQETRENSFYYLENREVLSPLHFTDGKKVQEFKVDFVVKRAFIKYTADIGIHV